MIIIAAVLGIAAVVVMIATGSFGSSQSAAYMNACKEAASQCKATHYSVPMDPCQICQAGCNQSGTELFQNAVICCKAGRLDMIYADSPGCQPPAPPIPPTRVELLNDDLSDFSAWSGSISTAQWHINSTYGYSGSSAMKGWTTGSTGGGYAEITHAQSMFGYKNIIVSFWSSRIFRASGYLAVDASVDGGAHWIGTGQMFGDEATWTYHQYTLPSEFENNPNFVIRISSSLLYSAPSVSSYVAVDDLTIIGDAIS